MSCRRATVGPGDGVGAPRSDTVVVAAPVAATVAVSVAGISAEFRSAEAARDCGLNQEDWSIIGRQGASVGGGGGG